jgi:ATP-dependent Clp protease protease subunit
MEEQINLAKLEVIKKNLEARVADKAKGIFFVNGVFDEVLLEFIYFDIKAAIENKGIEEIKIYINSNGGQVDVLFPLHDLIKSTTKKISTIVLGKAYSAGAKLLIFGTKGSRFAYSNSQILLHEVATSFPYGKNSQHNEDIKNLNRLNKKAKEMVKQNSKMTDKEINLYFESNKDIFITAQQALRYGLIDKIIC